MVVVVVDGEVVVVVVVDVLVVVEVVVDVVVATGGCVVAIGAWATRVDPHAVTLSANTVVATKILLRCVTCIN